MSCSKEGGFTAFCPQIKGAISEGETMEEAIENLKDALFGVFAVNAEMAEESRKTDSEILGDRIYSRQLLEFA